MRMRDWNGSEIEVATSAGGVLAVSSPWNNVVRTGVSPWPPPELIQKVYQSWHARAFRGSERDTATASLGFYSDLQSLRSEDAITWSVFGPLAYAAPKVRRHFTRALLNLIDVPAGPLGSVHIWLWRRLPHPDSLVPGGPEIDFGIQTDDLFLLREAKWMSGIGAAQGIRRDKDQLMLRREFCTKYGSVLLPRCKRFVVLGVSLHGGLVAHADDSANGTHLLLRDTSWDSICRIPEHPVGAELQRYIEWKRSYSGAS